MSLISYLTTIRFQASALSDVGNDMRELGIRTPLIVTDAGIARVGLVDRLIGVLSAGQPIPVFAGHRQVNATVTGPEHKRVRNENFTEAGVTITADLPEAAAPHIVRMITDITSGRVSISIKP
jgi:hypothetical protein